MFRQFTDEEIGQISRVHDFQLMLLQAQKPLTELLVCVAGDGISLIDEVTGGNDQAGLSTLMLREIEANGGCRLIHNHPSEGSLSYADWFLAAEHPGIDEIVAVNSSGSLFRGRAVATARSTLAAKTNAKDVSPDVGRAALAPAWTAYAAAIKKNLLPIPPQAVEDLLAWVWSHLVNERLHALGLVEYEAELSVQDKTTLTHPDVAALILAGRAEATNLV